MIVESILGMCVSTQNIAGALLPQQKNCRIFVYEHAPFSYCGLSVYNYKCIVYDNPCCHNVVDFLRLFPYIKCAVPFTELHTYIMYILL